MRIIGINGSPRKNANSASLLGSALASIEKAGCATVKYNLVDLKFSGCMSCFLCKRRTNRAEECVLKDDLQPVLKSIRNANGLIISMPVYYGDVPGMVRNFYERLFFPGLLYSKDGKIAYENRVKTMLIYNMNEPDAGKYGNLIKEHRCLFEKYIGPTRTLVITDTAQFDNYDNYVGDYYDPTRKELSRRDKFPEDCRLVQETASKYFGNNE